MRKDSIVETLSHTIGNDKDARKAMDKVFDDMGEQYTD